VPTRRYQLQGRYPTSLNVAAELLNSFANNQTKVKVITATDLDDAAEKAVAAARANKK
jgi:hypothetical protein